MNILSSLRLSETAHKQKLPSVDAQSKDTSSLDANIQTARSSVDTVSISRKGYDYNQSNSYFSRFFPGREGMDTEAILNGLLHPGSTSSSQGKTFSETAQDARKRMDEKYEKMKSGAPFDSKNLRDVYSLLGDLDRRSLFAVSSNEQGLFTKEEQAAAAYVMRQQQSMATGIYSGLPDLESDFNDPFKNDITGRIKAGLDFLKSLSEEEKQSSYWQKQWSGLIQALQSEAETPVKDDAESSKQGERHLILAEIMTQWSSGTPESKDFNGDKEMKNVYNNITGQHQP
jgi:hypothetical protein